MADAESGKGRKLLDRVTLAIAALAPVVSTVALYVQFLKGCEIRAYRPTVIDLTKSQIGIPIVLTRGEPVSCNAREPDSASLGVLEGGQFSPKREA